MSTASTSTALDRFLDSVADCWPPAVAQQILALPPDAISDERLEELRQKANEGDLTAEERSEYDELIEAMDLMSLIKLKARMVLARRRK